MYFYDNAETLFHKIKEKRQDYYFKDYYFKDYCFNNKIEDFYSNNNNIELQYILIKNNCIMQQNNII